MMSRRALRWVAALLLATAAASPALAQDSGQVGPPELRGFQLEPRREPVPPPTEPEPRIAPLPQAPPTAPASDLPVVETGPEIEPPPAAATQEPAAAAVRAASPARPVQRRPESAATSDIDTAGKTPATSAPPPEPATTSPVAPAPATRKLPTSAAREPDWWWAVAAAGLVALAGLIWLLRRRRRPVEIGRHEPADVVEQLPYAAPAPPPPAPRPWIELAFKPARAAATDAQATVHYELTVRNTGDAGAEAVLIRSNLFSAGATEDSELMAFCAGEIPGEYLIDPLDIAPGGQAVLHAVATLPRAALREVHVQGRPLFIPMVAFSAHYSWSGEGHGHTAASYLVGRETAPAQEKMAPFRLDLGPRIYAAVGQRPGQMAMMS